MRVVQGGHFWQFGSIAFVARETTNGEILVTFFWPKHGLRSDLRVPNSQNFSCPQTPLPSSHLSARNGRTTLK